MSYSYQAVHCDMSGITVLNTLCGKQVIESKPYFFSSFERVTILANGLNKQQAKSDQTLESNYS